MSNTIENDLFGIKKQWQSIALRNKKIKTFLI